MPHQEGDRPQRPKGEELSSSGTLMQENGAGRYLPADPGGPPPNWKLLLVLMAPHISHEWLDTFKNTFMIFIPF